MSWRCAHGLLQWAPRQGERGLGTIRYFALQVAQHLPIAVPMHLIWSGRWKFMQGDAQRAAVLLNSAAEKATALELPLYTERARGFLDQLSPDDRPQRAIRRVSQVSVYATLPRSFAPALSFARWLAVVSSHARSVYLPARLPFCVLLVRALAQWLIHSLIVLLRHSFNRSLARSLKFAHTATHARTHARTHLVLVHSSHSLTHSFTLSGMDHYWSQVQV